MILDVAARSRVRVAARSLRRGAVMQRKVAESRPPRALTLAVIDAGHGGQSRAGDSTPEGVRGPMGTAEKDVTLDLARRVARHLGGAAASVLTRDDDYNLSLSERAALAQRHGAPVFVSLHANGGGGSKRGAETYLHTRAGVASNTLAVRLHRRLMNLGCAESAPLRADLALLTPERLPGQTAACLVEVDYLSDPNGERNLRDASSRDRLALAIAQGVKDYLYPSRYGDVPGTEPETRPANPREVAERLLRHYLSPYLTRLSEEAQRRLVEAWREAPGGVIAASAILGAAGIGYLVGTNSALPSLPAIPLDTLGGVFQGAELRLRLNGPITNPESFQFSITFRERTPPRPRPERPAAEVYIDELLPSGSSPEDIAARVDGPEFETEVPGEGPDSDIALYLGEFVRGIGNHLLREVRNDPVRPWLDLGHLPPLPGSFGRGLERIVDALVDALPDRFGAIEQVNFITRYGDDVRWIPAIPRARRVNAEAQALEADGTEASEGDLQDYRVSACVLRVRSPAVLPDHANTPDWSRISNNHSTAGRILLRNGMAVLAFENTADQDVNCHVTISDDENNGVLCQADIDVLGVGVRYLEFRGFPLRADQVSPMTSCRYEVTVTNLRREREGVELWFAIFV